MKTIKILITIFVLSTFLGIAQQKPIDGNKIKHIPFPKENAKNFAENFIKKQLINDKESSKDDIPDFFSDLVKITGNGGTNRVDSFSIAGILLGDSVLHYSGPTYNFDVIYLIEFIKNGEVLDQWEIGVDTALVNYTLQGTIENIILKEEIMATSSEFTISGLSLTSPTYQVDAKISPMRILGLRLKWWLIYDLFIEGYFEYLDIVIDKASEGLESGSVIVNLIVHHGEGKTNQTVYIELTGEGTAIVHVGDEEYEIPITMGKLFCSLLM